MSERRLIAGRSLHAVAALLTLFSGSAYAQQVSTRAESMTDNYLSDFGGDAMARSAAYFEGIYWFQLLGTLIVLLTSWLVLRFGILHRLDSRLSWVGRSHGRQVVAFFLAYMLIAAMLMFPLTFFEGYVWEHWFGFSNQNFISWFVQQSILLLVLMLIGLVVVSILYWIVRRAESWWWAWSGIATAALLALVILISPVLIAPLFNEYTPLEEGPLREELLTIANANGVYVDDVWVYDGSRQSDRIGASVNGLFGTTTITLSDNLLDQLSADGVKAVMAHELGHYVLNHGPERIIQAALVFLIGLAFTELVFSAFTQRWGQRWNIAGRADPAGLPIAIAALSVYMLLASPLLNSIVRTNETEADIFGINTARAPDGFVEAVLKTAEFRKVDPSLWEERLFFDHPSPRNRILMAMRWKLATDADQSGVPLSLNR